MPLDQTIEKNFVCGIFTSATLIHMNSSYRVFLSGDETNS